MGRHEHAFTAQERPAVQCNSAGERGQYVAGLAVRLDITAFRERPRLNTQRWVAQPKPTVAPSAFTHKTAPPPRRGDVIVRHEARPDFQCDDIGIEKEARTAFDAEEIPAPTAGAAIA